MIGKVNISWFKPVENKLGCNNGQGYSMKEKLRYKPAGR